MATYFGEKHPIVAKMNQNLIEAFHLTDESEERMKSINDICETNVNIVKASYGEDSLYCVRFMYTLFTARLHESTADGSNQVLSSLA